LQGQARQGRYTGAPLWTLEGLRGADPVLGMAILMAVGVVLADALHRLLRLPRACGYMLVGAFASPLVLRLLERSELDAWKPLIDLATAVLVFELGTRIRPRWLVDNPWLALTCVLEGLLAGIAVTFSLIVLNAPPLSAALAGTVAMSTSPVIAMAVLHESQPRGQVTERLLLMTAVNSVLAILALKVWHVIAVGTEHDLLSTGAGALYVITGSFLLGAGACGAPARCRCCRLRWSSSRAWWRCSGRCHHCSRCSSRAWSGARGCAMR